MRKKKKLWKIREKIELEEKQIDRYKKNGDVEMEACHRGSLAACKTVELLMLISYGQMEDTARLMGEMIWKEKDSVS